MQQRNGSVSNQCHSQEARSFSINYGSTREKASTATCLCSIINPLQVLLLEQSHVQSHRQLHHSRSLITILHHVDSYAGTCQWFNVCLDTSQSVCQQYVYVSLCSFWQLCILILSQHSWNRHSISGLGIQPNHTLLHLLYQYSGASKSKTEQWRSSTSVAITLLWQWKIIFICTSTIYTSSDC